MSDARKHLDQFDEFVAGAARQRDDRDAELDAFRRRDVAVTCHDRLRHRRVAGRRVYITGHRANGFMKRLNAVRSFGGARRSSPWCAWTPTARSSPTPRRCEAARPPVGSKEFRGEVSRHDGFTTADRFTTTSSSPIRCAHGHHEKASLALWSGQPPPVLLPSTRLRATADAHAPIVAQMRTRV